MPVAAPDPALQLVDRGRLVAGRLEVADDLEAAVEPRNVERHDINGTPQVRQLRADHGGSVIGFDIPIVCHISPG